MAWAGCEDKECLGEKPVFEQNSSIRASIEWYSKHCRKTRRFCQQLSQAQALAAAQYRLKMKEMEKELKIEGEIVRSIEGRNPDIGYHLANNMKDYILARLNEDFY